MSKAPITCWSVVSPEVSLGTHVAGCLKQRTHVGQCPASRLIDTDAPCPPQRPVGVKGHFPELFGLSVLHD